MIVLSVRFSHNRS